MKPVCVCALVCVCFVKAEGCCSRPFIGIIVPLDFLSETSAGTDPPEHWAVCASLGRFRRKANPRAFDCPALARKRDSVSVSGTRNSVHRAYYTQMIVSKHLSARDRNCRNQITPLCDNTPLEDCNLSLQGLPWCFCSHGAEAAPAGTTSAIATHEPRAFSRRHHPLQARSPPSVSGSHS